MDRGTGGVGILVGIGLIVHGFLSLMQCSGITVLEFIVMDCGSITNRAEFELIIGFALGIGCFFAMPLPYPPKNPPRFKP